MTYRTATIAVLFGVLTLVLCPECTLRPPVTSPRTLRKVRTRGPVVPCVLGLPVRRATSQKQTPFSYLTDVG